MACPRSAGTISGSIFLSRNGGPKPTQRAGDYSSLSRVIGRSLTRLPVAL